MNWKYGMILIARGKYTYTDFEGEGTGECEIEDDMCMLVELFSGDSGEYHSYSETSIDSPKELSRAHTDVSRDGVNTWFYENGTFTWNCNKEEWDYTWKKR